MKTNIHRSNFDPLIKLFVKNQGNPIQQKIFVNDQRRPGEFFEDNKKPASLLLNADRKSISESAFEQQDLIIDFTNHLSKSRIKHRKLQLILNEDGSIQAVFDQGLSSLLAQFETTKRLRTNKLINFELYSKNPLFFEEDLDQIPFNKWFIYFGESRHSQAPRICLAHEQKAIAFVQFANDEASQMELAKQRYWYSKFTLDPFASFDCPSEYFTKNPLQLVSSCLVQKPISIPSQKEELQVAFINEAFVKTAYQTTLEQSVFGQDLMLELKQVQESKFADSIKAILSKSDWFRLVFFSFAQGSFAELQTFHHASKLHFTDFRQASMHYPAFYDYIELEMAKETALGTQTYSSFLKRFARKHQTSVFKSYFDRHHIELNFQVKLVFIKLVLKRLNSDTERLPAFYESGLNFYLQANEAEAFRNQVA